MIYTLYLLKKYDNLTIPVIRNSKYSEEVINKLALQQINYSPVYSAMRDILMFGYDVFPEMMPYIILWKDSNLYWKDDNLDSLIKNYEKNNKRFFMIKLTIFTKQNNLHANIILFDKKDNSYRRFEPYGNLLITNETELDKILLDLFKKYFKNIKYYRPSDYLESGRFQSISNDGSSEVRKVGDPMGFCLAWCFWYIEIRVKNDKLKEKELINMASDKIFNKYCDSKTPYNDFIRDYGLMLNDEKNKLFTSFEVNKNDFYDIIYKNTTLDKIKENIVDELDKLKLLN